MDLADRITYLILNTPLPFNGKQLAATIRSLIHEYDLSNPEISDAEILQRVNDSVKLFEGECEDADAH